MTYGIHNSKDKDKNTGRGEQVTEHYLSGAVANNGRKNYKKTPLNFFKKLSRRIPIKIGRAKRRSYFAAKRRGWRESLVQITLTRRA